MMMRPGPGMMMGGQMANYNYGAMAMGRGGGGRGGMQQGPGGRGAQGGKQGRGGMQQQQMAGGRGGMMRPGAGPGMAKGQRPGGPMPAAGGSPGALNAATLASAPPEQQKQLLGERLFPLIQSQEPQGAGKITVSAATSKLASLPSNRKLPLLPQSRPRTPPSILHLRGH